MLKPLDPTEPLESRRKIKSNFASSRYFSKYLGAGEKKVLFRKQNHKTGIFCNMWEEKNEKF